MPVRLEYVPPGQRLGTVEPTGQKPPRGQGMQEVAPVAPWYVPAGQVKHDGCLVRSLYVPGAHFISASEPTGQNVPSLHMMQSSSLVITSSALF